MMQQLLIVDTHNALKTAQALFDGRQWDVHWMQSSELEEALSGLLFHKVDQVLVAANDFSEIKPWLGSLQASFPQIPVLVLEQKQEKAFRWEGSCRVLSHKAGYQELFKHLTEGFQFTAWNKHFHESWLGRTNEESFGPEFFENLDIFHVLDRVLAYCDESISCEDIYWVRKEELIALRSKDFGSLALEVESDFYKSSKLRALKETSGVDVIKWLRALPPPDVFSLKGKVVQAHNLPGMHLCIPVVDQKTALGYLYFRNVKSEEAQEPMDRLEKSIQKVARFLGFALQMWDMSSLAYIDDLTELYNQRFLPEVLDREMARADRQNIKFTLLFMDVDFFKKINDSIGHWVGSRLLIELGQIIKNCIRSCDYAFRYGGDEFVLVLVDADSQTGKVVAERIRKRIEENIFVIDDHNIKLTMSIGLATFPDHASTRQDLVELADEAMYQGKRKSRNIVYIAS